jgi:hypothetical protein
VNRALAALFALAAISWLRLAAATDAPTRPLRLQVRDCKAAQVSVLRLVELLNTEIAPRSVEWVDDVASEPNRIQVILCHFTPNEALLSVFRNGDAISERQVDLSDVEGESRMRTLATILAETLAAAEQKPKQVEEAKTNAAAVEPPAQPRSGSVRVISGSVQPATSPAMTRSWHSGAALLMREYSRAGSPFFGTEIRLGYGRFEAELSLGRSHVTANAGDITHSFTVLATTFELARFFRAPELVPRLRFETGLAWAQSSSRDVDTVSNTRVAPLSAAMLELVLRQHVVSQTSVELKALGGYSGGLTATENGAPRSSTSGWIGSLGLGLGFDW